MVVVGIARHVNWVVVLRMLRILVFVPHPFNQWYCVGRRAVAKIATALGSCDSVLFRAKSGRDGVGGSSRFTV